MPSCGQPCAACQSSVGTSASTAIAAPSHNAGRRSSSRGPQARIAIPAASQKPPMRNFAYNAIAVTTPVQTSRPSARVRSQRTSSHSTSVQRNGSTVDVAR